MQYVSLKVLFQRNQKAAFIALDKQIAECQTYASQSFANLFELTVC